MEPRQWLERYRRAWEDADSDAVGKLFSENATYRSNIFEEAHVGSVGIRDYWARVTSDQSATAVLMGEPYGDETRMAVEWWTVMIEGGKQVTLPGCLMLRFDDQGLCTRLHEYWMLEHGAHDPPPEWGT